MPTTDAKTPDSLATAARDISRHIAGLADELLHMHHANGGTRESAIDHQLDKLRDQIALLTAVVNDLARAEHQT